MILLYFFTDLSSFSPAKKNLWNMDFEKLSTARRGRSRTRKELFYIIHLACTLEQLLLSWRHTYLSFCFLVLQDARAPLARAWRVAMVVRWLRCLALTLLYLSLAPGVSSDKSEFVKGKSEYFDTGADSFANPSVLKEESLFEEIIIFSIKIFITRSLRLA